ncbi:hypothetical protein EV207_11868 [Scopulibacillus darangshiensis]|uniref:Uncharacterized protein n=1 Tax=Scopulibacillus darangshiensis TaxID=442528 RepID=A0A4R2NY19_9BACL|nr:hypothetical protein [Scopulibacillus darangshiensis]TCP27090.1 hypothetical protein EV207_11868 [Scopulibacillus darangshiensis]
MLQIKLGEHGQMDVDIIEIVKHDGRMIDFYYKDFNEPDYISNYWITLQFVDSNWSVTHFCVYHSNERIYKDVQGLFSSAVLEPLKNELLSYIDSKGRKIKSPKVS